MFIRYFRILWKFPLLVLFISTFLLIGIFNKFFFLLFPKIRKTLAQRNTQWACWLCRNVVGYRGNYRISHIPKGQLLICNHMSYMDVLVIASKVPTLFVTSLEMKRTPVLGWITQIGECLYVDRKSHKNINNEIEVIQSWINKGLNVLIFPEATTSNGVQLRPFKSSLLKITQNSQIPITVYCLKYLKINSKPTSDQDKINILSWFDDADFITHLLKQCMVKSVEFELKELETFPSDRFDDRKSLVSHLETKITTEYYNTL